jgi:S-adenosylmethionine hydrolase
LADSYYEAYIMKALQVYALAAMLLVAMAAVAGHHRQVTGNVAYVGEEYGNIDTDITPERLVDLEVGKGDTFTVGFGDKEFEVYLGDTYSDVPKGDWIAFINSSGTLRIARNFDNAAETLGVVVGDEITLYN